MRIGHGYDVHRFADERRLVLGGVDIEFAQGLLGNSDADVLVHAIIDSLLGAAALGDIGMHFPDSDERYKNADSLQLLKGVCFLLRTKGYRIINIDSTVVAEKPKLRSYIEQMRQNIAFTCNIEEDCVSVKATTEEGLGFTGKMEGIAAHAVCLIEEVKPKLKKL